MTALEVQRWDVRNGDLSESLLRLRYLPAWHHRISVHEYQPGVTFNGTARAGELFVLAGQCRVRWAHHQPCSLERLDFIVFPAGDFTFEVLGYVPCKVAKVWVLPPEFRTLPKETI
jgi:hypothetical protein